MIDDTHETMYQWVPDYRSGFEAARKSMLWHMAIGAVWQWNFSYLDLRTARFITESCMDVLIELGDETAKRIRDNDE